MKVQNLLMSCFIGHELLSIYKPSGGGGVKQVKYVIGINKWAFSFTICRIRNLKQKAGLRESRAEPSDRRFIIWLNSMFKLLKTTAHLSLGKRLRYHNISDITVIMTGPIHNLVCVLLLDFSVKHRLSITNTMFQDKIVLKWIGMRTSWATARWSIP